MPTAREALLNAALAALTVLPWSAVRMVDIASAAGVSRQTLYNEFGSKEGLARALVRREADAYLQGVERVLAAPAGTPRRNLAAVAEWTVSEACTRPVLRALLTGCWGERLPTPRPARAGSRASAVPAQRRADAGVPSPADLLGLARDRAATALHDGEGDVRHDCEVVLRLALSYVVAPTPVVTPPGGPDGQWADPESWRPMTPTITSVIDRIFSVDTTSPRKIIP
ncbi:TetR/AcrR family transcriptional regulator [Streptomyces sp. P9(2023)]|uniref:TetR/AcrR family transcriptional regulator n=1 Tax=Streptomyces sp. P9(2023) TaxID=3064394 RepID=UPI0028F3F1C8|nr:TetR/AcrR family transcriptional regulator [Streptomyces sp. P9(2023)]MDT9688263.1 TetR/AcrR family transcriptional regulator [Streptomyces sp. P9(2023)]